MSPSEDWHIIVRTLLCITLAVTCTITLWAQSTTLLQGRVTDSAGKLLPNIKVTLTNPSNGMVRSATSGKDGTYEIPSVAPGTYDVSAEGQQFSKVGLKNYELLVNTPNTLDFKVADSIKIEVNLVDATVGNALSHKQIESLPLEDRSPVALLGLQPGVVYTGIEDTKVPDTRGGSVAGGRSDQSNLTLDGIDDNNQQSGKAFESALPITQESVQEFRAVVVNPNAVQGRSSAGQISLITRRGENMFHGSLYEYWRNSVTSANNFFNNSTLDPVTGKTLERPNYNRNIFGGSLGGPIQKNKLFFFVNIEDSITRREEPQIRVVPSQSLRQAILKYPDPNGDVQSISPAELKEMDQLHIGPNAAMLSFMQMYPIGNDPTQGDGDLNFTGYRFNGPLKEDKPSYIGRIDYNISSRQNIFVRGSLADYTMDNQAPQFPGQAAAQLQHDTSRGIAVGHSFAISPNLVNALHWGITRQAIEFAGGNTSPGLAIGGMDNFLNFDSRNNSRSQPTQNLVEDLTWVTNRHTLQFGVNFRNIHNKRYSEEKTYPFYYSNSGWMASTGLDILPADIDPSFQSSYVNAQMALLGTINQVDVTYYTDRNDSTFPSPHVPRREFINREFEWYAQDQWKVMSDLTVTAGLRYSYFAPPFEKNGFQVRANFDVNAWFATRSDNSAAGIPSNTNPLLSFVLAGKANHAPPTFDPDKNNFAPRLALAWSPSFRNGLLHSIFGDRGQSSIRVGTAVLFDRTGGMFPITTDLEGAVGLATLVRTPPEGFNYSTAPRFTGLENLSSIPVPAAPESGFPSTPGFTNNTGFMVDSKLRTPYSTTFNLSISRNLPGALTIEGAYVGRIGRKLLVLNDFAAPLVNFKDPQSGQTWVTATGSMADFLDRHTSIEDVPPIPFFENIFAPMASGNSTATQAFYDLLLLAGSSWMDALHYLDTQVPGGSTIYGPHTFFQQQFDWLPAWTNLGQSTYHSFQLIVRKRLTQGLQADFNYTFAKSFDNGSSVESEGSGYGQILNAFAPQQSRSLSDFDIRHQLNSNFVLDIPVGHNQPFLADMPPVLNSIFSGWTLSGLLRWRTGFPFPTGSGNVLYPTNYFVKGPPTMVPGVRAPESGVTKDASGGPNVFADPEGAYSSFQHTRSGDSGSRNVLYGPGYFSVDTSLERTFILQGSHRLRFRWETYNVANNVNFDGRPNAAGNQGIDFNLDSRSTFGRLRSTAGSPRIMQFALRYEF